jgi:hypothetical protein
MTRLLALALIGNCSIAAPVNGMGKIERACLLRFDSDALFCSLRREHSNSDDGLSELRGVA